MVGIVLGLIASTRSCSRSPPSRSSTSSSPRLYETGRIGPLAARRRAEASGDAAAIAESDPSYNPYARED